MPHSPGTINCNKYGEIQLDQSLEECFPEKMVDIFYEQNVWLLGKNLPMKWTGTFIFKTAFSSVTATGTGSKETSQFMAMWCRGLTHDLSSLSDVLFFSEF